jgi:type IV secretion system protein VirD4
MNRFAAAPWPHKAAAAAALALAAATVFAAVSLAIALLGLHRLGRGLDPAAVPSWFWYFRGDPQVQRWLKVGALTTVGLAIGAAVGVAGAFRRPLHGAARWASEAELRRAGLRARTGIVLARRGGRPLVFGGEEHVALYAPTRTGKGVGVVIPNLLTWPGSAVVLDVKRENWDASAGYRARHGQRVLLFDPLEPEGRTARFNPLGHIARADPIQVLDELQRIAAMLFPLPEAADPFWAESARTGFVGIAAYLAESPDRNFTFGSLYAELTSGDPRIRFPAAIAARREEGRPLSPGCVRALTDFCSSSENTFAGIRQTLTSRLNLWLNPRVCAATAASDFDLRDLKRQGVSLYLATSPENLSRVAPLYNLLFQQLVDLSCRRRPQPGERQVLVLLDEFARLGHAPVIAKGFAYVAGYGLRLLPVLQSPAQLRGEYGPELAEEILSNCGVEVVFAPKDLRLAQGLSERLGYSTVKSPSRSRPSGLSRGHRSISESDQRRALLLPQELMQLPDEDLIILKAGLAPVRGRKIRYYRDRSLAARVCAPPEVPACPAAKPEPTTVGDLPLSDSSLTLEALAPALAEAGLEPLPQQGATPEAVEAWVDRFLEQSAVIPLELSDHGR